MSKEPPRLRPDEPVIVLTCGRSGSTLMRFILDAHPELACPPETRIVNVCTQMGMLAMTLDGPSPGDRGGLSAEARAAIRSWVTGRFEAYLLDRGKSRWCDKSIGSAESAGRFLDLFPQAKFICLYRHGLDVIDSFLEACPWGLRGYGVDTYTAAHPGNSVAALADFWVSQTRAIVAFEQAHPDACVRVRYEDLVADPAGEAKRIFSFLDEDPSADVTRLSFATERRSFDPADYKIWTTTGVRPDSVGRGARIPVQTISPPILAMVNDLLQNLGYPAADEHGGSPRRSGSGQAPLPATAGTGPPPDTAPIFDGLEMLLTSRIAGSAASRRDSPGAGHAAAFTITATTRPAAGSAGSRSWIVDTANARITWADGPDRPGRGVLGPSWEITGEAATWILVLSGQLNLGTAIRHSYLRYLTTWADDMVVVPQLSSDERTRCLAQWLTPGVDEATPAAGDRAGQPT